MFFLLGDKFPSIRQKYIKDCGPVSLQIILASYGIKSSARTLRELCSTGRHGSTLLELKRASEKLGFFAKAVKSPLNQDLLASGPFIAYLPERKHFVVVYKMTLRYVYVSDPARGKIRYSIEEFEARWITENEEMGVALILASTGNFVVPEENRKPKKESELKNQLFTILRKYKWHFIQLLFFIGAFTLFQVLIPVLTQRLIDTGISLRNVNFIYIILGANLAVLIGRTVSEVIRSWLLLHLSARVNINLLFYFFKKVLALPISFFDSKVIEDYLQRIEDHARIENLITSSSLSFLFSFITFVIYTIILGFYSTTALLIYVIGSFLYFLWISFFFRQRAIIDTERFERLTAEREKVYEILSGMQEIKLQNLQPSKLAEWSRLQLRLFATNVKTLKVDQFQTVGSNLINEAKNLTLIIFCATLVISGNLTLGSLLAISYIIGVLNAPLFQIFSFLKSFQDSMLAMNRIEEIYDEAQESEYKGINELKSTGKDNLTVKNLTFRYAGESRPVFSNVSFSIPLNKTTAIVGPSGSGKTTLMKILLKFYKIEDGAVTVGNVDLNEISLHAWRSNCGTVMQEGFLFNGTIAKNIALDEERIDFNRLEQAIRVACIEDFINELPAGYNTLIGQNGRPLSGGQKQRILIARAIYKQPEFFLFDEATSSLDAVNEKNISVNLDECFKGKTAVIIAHRLSTIRRADKIIVINNGHVVEEGTHDQLQGSGGYYYELIKHQLQG